jgi:integrase
MAQEWKVIDRVPRIRLLGGEHRREFVLGHELEPAYLGACAQPLRDIALLMIDAGLRMGEALSLCWQDVTIKPAGAAKYGYLTVRAGKSKNSKGRNMPLSQRVQEMLKTREPEAAGLVFHREDGTSLLPTSVNHQHSAVRKDMKLPADFTPHSLRHTFGTRLGESGAEAFTIMKLMGHSSVTISQLYVHPTPDTIERAFERLQAVNEKARSGAVLLSGLPADGTEEEAA